MTNRILTISAIALTILAFEHQPSFSQVTLEWVARYNVPGVASSIALDGSGNIYVTGGSVGSGTFSDYTTVKYNSSGVQQWVASYNGSENFDDHASSVKVDGLGNVYVTGSSWGSGTRVDYATIKYNSAGVQQWVARYNGPANLEDLANSLVVDGSGNIYVTGTSASETSWDYATVKYNSSGVQQWVERYNGPGNLSNIATSLEVDGSGNVYVTGYSEVIGPSWDYITIKYNSAGVQQWVERYNGPGNADDQGNSIAVDGSGNVYVTGNSVGSGTSTDYATIKYNSAGVQQWVARYNGPPGNSGDVANSIAVDGSGNVYATGNSYGSGTSSDYATVKYNSSGVQQWVERYNGTGNLGDKATSLEVDGSGNVYVTGYSEGIGTGRDYATIKYNSSGVQQWVERYDGTGNAHDEGNSIAVDGSGNVYVTGNSEGIGTSTDYATIKYSQQTSQLSVISPNGGETFLNGQQLLITWNSLGVQSVKIEFTSNNGGTWSTLSASYPADSGRFAWTVPNINSTQCKIKITDSNDPGIYDISNSSFTIAPVTLNTGLIAYYPFNGSVNDESGNNNHGTNYGATLTTDNNGIPNSSYEFNGSSNYVSIPDFNILNISNLTFSCMVYPRSLNNSVIVYHGYSGEIQMNTYNGNQLGVGVKLANNYWYYCNVNALQNNWYLLTGVWERGNSLKLYLNGQFFTETSVPNYDLYEEHYHNSSIGAYSRFMYPSQAQPFLGKIDEVRFYNRALSQSEIQQLFNQSAPITQPSISVSPIQINPGGNVNITGQNFRANAQVKVNVTSSNSQLVLDQTYTTNSAGGFNASYSSNVNSSPGIYTVSAYDIATSQNAPNKIFQVIQPVDNYYLNIVSPADTSILPDSVDRKINVEWKDKMIPENGYTIVGSKRNYKYSVNYSIDDGNSWEPDSIIIAGTEFVNSIPLFRAQVNLDSLLGSRGGLNVKLRVTDLIKTNRYDNTTSFPVRLNNLNRANVNLIWDYSYPERTGSPIGACADGVSRFYIKISKVPGNTITGISIYLSDDINSTSERVLGKLTGANVTDHYSDEANNASSTSFNENISRNDYWIWYVSPDDFNRYGASDDSKIERNVKLNVTVSYSSGLPEAKTINLKIIRQPLMLVHGFNSNHHVWDDFIRNKNINSLFKFYSTPNLDPKGTYDANAILLLNYFQSETNHYQSFRYIINKARQAGYASNQVSYVCHSMGGCIVRAASQSHNFEDIINYNKGFVNRIITVDTPHDGSPLADLVVNFFDHIPNKARIFAEFADADLIRSTYRVDENYNVYPSFSVINLQVRGYGRYNFQNTYIPSYLIAGDLFPGTSNQFGNIDWNTLNVGEMSKYLNFLDFIFEYSGKLTFRSFFYNPEDYDEVKNLLNNRSMNRIEKACKLFNLFCNKYFVTENFLANSDFVVSVESQLAGTNRSIYNTFDHYNNDPNLLGVGHTLYNECTKDEIIANNIISHLNLPITANNNFIQYIPSTRYYSPSAISNPSFAFPKEPEDVLELNISLPEDGKICYVDSLLSISFSIDNTDSLKYVSLSFQGEKYYDTSKSSLYNFNILVNSNELDTCFIYANAVYISGDSVDISDAYRRIFVRSNYPVVDFEVNNEFYFMINNETITPEYKSVFTNGIYKGVMNNISATVENPSIIMFNNSDKSFKALSNGGTFAIVSNGGQSDTIYFSVNGEVVMPGVVNLADPKDSATIQPENIRFSWKVDELAWYYEFQLAKDVDFESILFESENLSDTATSVEMLEENQIYYWRVRATNSGGSGNWSTVRTLKVLALRESYLYLNLIPQGLYNTALGQLNRMDTVRVYLTNIYPPFNIVDSSISVIDSISFQGLFKFPNTPTGNYYIKIAHFNSIETWSKTGGEYFKNHDKMYFDLTSSQDQAYGDNTIMIDSLWCIFSGDVNQDGTVDATDVSAVDNDAANFVSGYVNTDLTGDGFVDGTDFVIADNNAASFVGVVRP